MGLVENTKAVKDFEELLSAAWAAQLAKLRAKPNSDERQTEADSQESSGEEGEAR